MTSPVSELKPQRPNWRDGLASWLVDRLPTWFDRTLGQAKTSLLWGLCGLALVLTIPLIVAPLKIWQQAAIAVFLMFLGWLIVELEQRRAETRASEYLHLLLIGLSLITTSRYLYYRISYTLNLDNWLDGFFSLLLLAAELYAILTLVLAYFQTLRLKDRTPPDIAAIPHDQHFKVDIYIPTYNEDVEIVRKTVLGALATDYPADKKRVYVLDDGRKFPERREKLREMCEELNCTMLVRPDNSHAKAGNINTAMHKTEGDLILILDCDHIPTRDILKNTVGFFYNPKVALVQTPHWFYNPDPFERNLLTGGRVPVGNELFYKVLQKGNDFWNAAFFCGSAAVIRKEYVLQIGGIAVETVTEDCHTSFRLHSLGYESVYYDKIMVAGLAPEKFSSYVGQQVRWARGMAQILRLENPMFNRKLKLTIPQRLCYFSATSHFFYGFPRLVYAIAPMLFLLFGINPIRGLGFETLVYALPHIILSTYANFIPYKNVRFSFWNEIYEFAMSFQAGIVTLMALINPKLGKFNVTDKGLSVTKRSFDWESSKALLVVTALVTLSIIAVPFWLILRPEDTEAVLINLFWSIFNLILLVGALLVALEQPQLRRAHRLDRKLHAILYSPNQTLKGRTVNVSETGCQMMVNTWPNLPDEVEVELIGDYGARAFLTGRILRATPINDDQVALAIDFIDLTPAQLDALSVVIYSDVREWYSQKRPEVDDPLESFKFIATSLKRSFREAAPATSTLVRKRVTTVVKMYWEGHFYDATATDLGHRSLRIELMRPLIANLEALQKTQPIVGLLVSLRADDPDPIRLLAQVRDVQTITNEQGGGQIAIELLFPDTIADRQQGRIRQLLAGLR
jgi:cellulose synthase (UDP-forming)